MAAPLLPVQTTTGLPATLAPAGLLEELELPAGADSLPSAHAAVCLDVAAHVSLVTCAASTCQPRLDTRTPMHTQGCADSDRTWRQGAQVGRLQALCLYKQRSAWYWAPQRPLLAG